MSAYSSTTRRDGREKDREHFVHARLLGETFESWERETAPAPFMIFRRGERLKGNSVACARSDREILNGADAAESVY